MTRTVMFGLLAAAALGTSALLPSAASAHGGHWFGHGHFGFYGIGPVVAVDDGCLVRQVVETWHGPRIRIVNVCGY